MKKIKRAARAARTLDLKSNYAENNFEKKKVKFPHLQFWL